MLFADHIVGSVLRFLHSKEYPIRTCRAMDPIVLTGVHFLSRPAARVLACSSRKAKKKRPGFFGYHLTLSRQHSLIGVFYGRGVQRLFRVQTLGKTPRFYFRGLGLASGPPRGDDGSGAFPSHVPPAGGAGCGPEAPHPYIV